MRKRLSARPNENARKRRIKRRKGLSARPNENARKRRIGRLKRLSARPKKNASIRIASAVSLDFARMCTPAFHFTHSMPLPDNKDKKKRKGKLVQSSGEVLRYARHLA